jgi:hypothetical protein
LSYSRRLRRFARLRPRHAARGAGLVALALVFAVLVRSGIVTGGPAAIARESRPAADAHADFTPAIHRVEGESRLDAAFAAAFGAPDSIVRRVGAVHEPTRFTPGALIDAPFGPVLVSGGEVIAPRPDSTGKLAIVYLRSGAAGLEPRRRFVPAIESGSMGRLDDFRVRSDLAPNPVVEVHGHGDWQGVRCGWITLLELRPDAPRELATIPSLYDDSEAGGGVARIAGEIGDVAPGREFEVTYSGSAEFRERYVRRGNAFVLASGKSRMRSC